MTTTSSLSSVSEALTSPSSIMSSSVSIPDHATIQCADSKVGESDSVDTHESPTSVISDVSSKRDHSHDLSRMQQLEQKRLALRSQRFCLEKRLYEFCGKHAEDGHVVESPLNKPTRHVLDYDYQQAGVKCMYSGPLNERDEPHGNNGILRFIDGQVYRGDLKNGQRWGGGSNSWGDKQEYTGEWKANSRNGRGTHTWPDGRQVSGQWKEGHLHGNVYFSWPNGATFDGTCKMGKKDGRGVHKYADGRVFTGHFHDGKEHGFGTLTYPDGVKYRGQFLDGFKHGYGIQLWKTRTYDGEWIENKPHGQGRVVWSNGATYTGQFFDGKYHGLGVYVWPTGKKFVGRWEHGVKNGHGLYTWPSGKKYDGEYKKGMKHGYGRMQWPDGQMYSGSWSDNTRCGRGIQTDPEGGLIHCGQWINDAPVGLAAAATATATIPKDVTVNTVDTPKKEAPQSKAASPVVAQVSPAQTEKRTNPAHASPHKDCNDEQENLSNTQDTSCSTHAESEADFSLECGSYDDGSPLVQMLSPSRLVL